jgi:hypothetical protein
MTLNLQTPFLLLVEVLVAGYAQLKKNMLSLGQVQEQIFEMPTGGAAIMRNGETIISSTKRTMLSIRNSTTYV